jgi:hypothetical protein
MARFTFVIALFLGLAACGDDASNNDGSAQVADAGYDGSTQD